MNFDDYANHIFQKYRLAIAFAIVRNTPENLTPKKYFENIKNHIVSKMETFDPDMTICEDDFDFNDNDECVNNDKNETINDHTEVNDTQFNDSVTILKDFDFEMMRNRNNDNDGGQNNSVSDVIRILKGSNEELEVALGSDGSNLNNTQSTYYESSQNATQTSSSAINNEIQTKTHTKFDSDTNLNIPKCYNQHQVTGPLDDTFYDSEKTVIYSLHGFTEFTHVSQSQVDNIVIPKYFINNVPIDNKNLKSSDSGLKCDDKNNINDVDSEKNEYKKNYKVDVENNHFTKINERNSKLNESSKVINKASNENNSNNGPKGGTVNNNFHKRDVKRNESSKIGNKSTKSRKYNERNSKQNEFSNSTKIEVDNNNFSKYSGEDFKQNELSESSKIGISNTSLTENNEQDYNQNRFNEKQIDKHVIVKKITNNKDASLNNLNTNRKCSQNKEIKEANQTNNTKHKYENNTENIEAKRPRHESSTNKESDLAYLDEVRSKFHMQECFTDLDIDLSNNSELSVKETNKNHSTPYTNTNSKEFEKYLNSTKVNFEKQSTNNFDSQNSRKSDKDGITSIFSNESQILNINAEEFANDRNSNTLNFENKTFDSQISRKSDKDEKINKVSDESQNLTQISTNETFCETSQNVEYNEIDAEELDNITASQAELVPFKVLEELSRIKAFLNKHNRRQSTEGIDSGYKSDSQTRSNFKSALQSNIWLNQSAHTILAYIARCPLTNKIVDISNEISRTLGQLIDRLHEEEKYPSFLEEHLEKVEELLKDIYENDTSDNILLKKDENVQRLFLLNRSSHIIKYTIGKILGILENAHTKLKSDDIFEINSVHEIENLSYIFHILEILLKRTLILKNISSQSTQSSQDEGILKKSSLTDIWRKKWNVKRSKFETDVNDGYSKQCVLEQCGVILNKIIVLAMDGYSLISFYALHCFNLLQN